MMQSAPASVLDAIAVPRPHPFVVAHDGLDTAVPLLFEGVLFNRHELAEVLAPERPDLDDAALVALAYGRWQDQFISRLKGQFAVVIWDRARRTWLAARDAIGVHPLFYARVNGQTVFASSIDAVLAHPGVSRDLNRPALVDHLCHRWPDTGETFFTAVRRVPCGSIVNSVDGAVTVRRYWDPVPAGRPVQWVHPDEAVDQFQRLFVQAVDRGVSRGRSGIFLSGGLDSVSVAAAATERAPVFGYPEPFALSLAFPHPTCDERDVQAGVARRLGLEQDLISMAQAVGPDGLLSDAVELSTGWPTLLLNNWAPAYARLAARGRAAGAEVILTGMGGDEWLGVTPYLAADMIRRGDWRGLAASVTTWQRSFRASRAKVVRQTFWTFGARPLASAVLARVAPRAWHRSRWNRLLRSSPPWVAADTELKQAMRARTEQALTPARPQDGFYFQEMRLALDHALVTLEYEENFELGARLGVRFQHPYCDVDLVDMLCRTPPEVLNRGGRAKGLVRDALERRFPALGFGAQRKIAATDYSRQLLRTEGAVAWQRCGGLPALGALGVVDAEAARVAGERALEGKDARELYRAFELVKLERWVRARLN